MTDGMNIPEKVSAYLAGVKGEHNREYSWMRCYKYFHERDPDAIKADCDHAALHLGFYLASWGMYRGSGFLLQYAYTIHLGVIDCLLDPKFSPLWDQEFGATESDATLIPLILRACADVRAVYAPFGKAKYILVTDLLVTKVILGTLGCLPAIDEYFVKGFRHSGLRVSDPINPNFIQQVLWFCRNNLITFKAEQGRIEDACGVHYPLMKLVDMYFHQVGVESTPSQVRATKAG